MIIYVNCRLKFTNKIFRIGQVNSPSNQIVLPSCVAEAKQILLFVCVEMELVTRMDFASCLKMIGQEYGKTN